MPDSVVADQGRECTSLPARGSSRMHRYSIFGGCLRSALELPGLPAAGSPDDAWHLRIASGAAGPDGPQLGSDEVDAGCTVRLHQQPNGLRLSYDDTGIFDISADGREIVWHPAPDATEELAGLDVIGRVLATAMHLGGILPLHGSAVAVRGRALAFVAPKTFGKSTLALALTNAGATFLSDDTLPVEPGAVPHVRPGVDHVRLWDDSARRLVARGKLDAEAARGKHVVAMRGSRPGARTPLGAVYMLAPVRQVNGYSAARREQLAAVPATVALVRHAKVGSLVGGAEAARLLDQASRVAHVVPVFHLEIARDLDRLPEAVETIMRWHSDVPQGTTGFGVSPENAGVAAAPPASSCVS